MIELKVNSLRSLQSILLKGKVFILHCWHNHISLETAMQLNCLAESEVHLKWNHLKQASHSIALQFLTCLQQVGQISHIGITYLFVVKLSNYHTKTSAARNLRILLVIKNF